MIGNRTLKSAIGATLAMLIADYFGFQYMASAGIITILSVQATKKQSIEMAFRRFIALMIALCLSSIIFLIFGYNSIAFGIYLLIFIPIATKYNLGDGIVPASVLITHILGFGTNSLLIWLNEICIFGIGAGIALILNLYIPSIEGELLQIRHKTEQFMYEILMDMARSLQFHLTDINEPTLYEMLENRIEMGQKLSYKQMNNNLSSKVSYYESYFTMRKNQLLILRYMKKHFHRLSVNLHCPEIIINFTRDVAHCVKGEISAKELLVQLEEIREFFKQSSLPLTREEFENRAMLYQFLNDMEQFLDAKIQFRDNLDIDELKLYWQGYRKS